jgi:hypothetical protein
MAQPHHLTAHEGQPNRIERQERRSGIVPRTVVRTDALTLHYLDPRGGASDALLTEAYDCWATVWREAFYELEGATVVHSDNFSRQDEIAAFFVEDQCIALIGHRFVDLREPMVHDDSYFRAWPKDALERAAAHGSRAFISNILTVRPEWRNSSGVDLKELCMGFSVKRFLQTSADCWIGQPRNNRGVTAVCYRLGCEALETEVPLHGVTVDLLAFYRATSKRGLLSPETEAAISHVLPD